MATAVSGFNLAPVKSLGLHHPVEIELTPRGVAEDRRFYLVDGDGRLVGGVRCGPLVRVSSTWDAETHVLALAFPDGSRVESEVSLGGPVSTDFYGKRVVHGHAVEGPWADALSDYASLRLQLVRVADESHATDIEPVTLVSDGSLTAIGGLDPRRFRMLIELSGCDAFEEDDWQGSLVRAGEALLRVGGPVPRCAVTTQDPDRGLRDHDTLRAIRALRGATDEKSIYFGMYAEVVEPGRVRVGDAVIPAG